MKLVIILSALTALMSYAAVAGEYKQFFLVNGHESSAEQAILAGLKGQEAFKCTAVETKVSKAGTSIGIRNIKKPRASN